MVVFSGSLPRGMNAADLDTLIYVALGGKAKVVLDINGKLLAQCTSVDLSVPVENESAPPRQGAKMLWMIKPNRRELAEAVGAERLEGERALLEAGQRLARRVSWVVLTLGSKGAILFGLEGIWRGWCDVKPEEIVSTVGCGDCLLAGVLDAQALGLEPKRVLQHGIAVATANAMRTGVAEFDMDLVRQMEARTQVETVREAEPSQ